MVAGRRQWIRSRVLAAGSGEAGQAAMFSVLWMVVILGMAGLVIDVGSWYRSQRGLQAQADASALAGAQDLPDSTANATSLAQTYATKNGLTLPAGDVSFSQSDVPNDSITVKVDKPAPTFFTKIFGLNTVNVHAQATAKSSNLGEAQYVAPIAVNIMHPLLSGTLNGSPCPCFNTETTLPLGKTGAPGAFALLDLDGQHAGTGTSDVASWIANGYDGILDIGDYFSVTGAKWDSNEIDDALTLRTGTVLMFPVYDTLTGNGSNALYHVIAWVGFRVDGFDASGINGSITGQFVTITWQGLPAVSNSGQPSLGARIITLTQ